MPSFELNTVSDTALPSTAHIATSDDAGGAAGPKMRPIARVAAGLSASLLTYVDVTKPPYNVSAGNSGAANVTALQAAFDAESDLLIPAIDIPVDGKVTIGAGVKRIQWDGRLVTAYQGVQDTNVYPIVDLSGFNGSVYGSIRILQTSPSGNLASDGVRLKNSTASYIERIHCDGARFATMIDTSSGFEIGQIRGDNLLGWQSGQASNGGSVATIYSSSKGRISAVTGDAVAKAALYFSIDGSGTNNAGIYVDRVDVTLAATPVANGVAFRSADSVYVGEIKITGGISAVRVEKRDDAASYVVNGVKIGRVIARNNNQSSSDSSAVSINTVDGAVTYGDIEIGSIDSDGCEDNTLFIGPGRSIRIGSLKSRGAGGRSIMLAGAIGKLEIGELDSGGAGSAVITSLAGAAGTGTIKIGKITIQDRGASALLPLNFALDTFKRLEIGSIDDLTASPAYAYIGTFNGAVAATNRISVDTVVSATTNVFTLRSAVITRVDQGRWYSNAVPTLSTWPADTVIYKSGSVAAGAWAWVVTTTGWKSVGNLAA